MKCVNWYVKLKFKTINKSYEKMYLGDSVVPNQKSFFLIKMYNNTSGANWFCCHLEFSRPKCIVVGLVTNYSGAAAAVDLVAVCRSSIKPG